MKIVGIAGAKQSGKDTLAKFVAAQALQGEPGYRVFTVAFADALKRMLLPLGFPADVLWGPSEARCWVHPVLGISARELLQKVGTEVARQIDPAFWVKAWVDTVSKLSTGAFTYTPALGVDRMLSKDLSPLLVIVPDLRFADEHAELHRRGAHTVLVEREAALQVDDQHASERWCREAARQCVREVVPNNGTMDELAVRAKGIFWAVAGYVAA